MCCHAIPNVRNTSVALRWLFDVVRVGAAPTYARHFRLNNAWPPVHKGDGNQVAWDRTHSASSLARSWSIHCQGFATLGFHADLGPSLWRRWFGLLHVFVLWISGAVYFSSNHVKSCQISECFMLGGTRNTTKWRCEKVKRHLAWLNLWITCTAGRWRFLLQLFS